MIKAALIGVSSYGRVHLRMLKEQISKGKLELVAATVINQSEEKELCAELRADGCFLYSDYETMLREWDGALDLCMIPTPIFLHETMTIAALRAGANVLVEKPLTPSIASAYNIIVEAAKAKRFVAVGFQKMYSKSTVAIKRDLLNGMIGELVELKGIALWPRPKKYYSRNAWAGRVSVGGELVLDSPISNAVAHFLHMMLYWAGETLEEVSGFGSNFLAEVYRANDIENFDTACLKGTTRSGIDVTFYASHGSRSTVEPIIKIVGTGGEIEWIRNRGVHYRGNGTVERVLPITIEEEEVSSMMNAIVNRIESGNGYLCEPVHTLPHVEIVEAIYRHCEVEAIPQEFIEYSGRGEDAIASIAGLEVSTFRAFERGALYSEFATPWATAPTRIPLKRLGSGIDSLIPNAAKRDEL